MTTDVTPVLNRIVHVIVIVRLTIHIFVALARRGLGLRGRSAAQLNTIQYNTICYSICYINVSMLYHNM